MPRKIGDKPCYQSWKKLVLIRDKNICQLCSKNNKRNRRGKYVRHIKSPINYPELRFVVSNGITLCKRCYKIFYQYKNNGEYRLSSRGVFLKNKRKVIIKKQIQIIDRSWVR